MTKQKNLFFVFLFSIQNRLFQKKLFSKIVKLDHWLWSKENTIYLRIHFSKNIFLQSQIFGSNTLLLVFKIKHSMRNHSSSIFSIFHWLESVFNTPCELLTSRASWNLSLWSRIHKQNVHSVVFDMLFSLFQYLKLDNCIADNWHSGSTISKSLVNINKSDQVPVLHNSISCYVKVGKKNQLQSKSRSIFHPTPNNILNWNI